MKNAFLRVALPLFLITFGSSARAEITDYRFRVLLDDRPIGRHSFRVSDDADGRAVTIEADFDVRVLFVPVYRYRHRNEERWQDGCLVSLRSETDDNGRDFAVRTERSGNGLRVASAEGVRELEGCVRSFAYWDRAFLEAPRLLNSQDGSVVPVRVDALGADAFEVEGRTLEAERWRLSGPKGLDISLWYGPDGRWIGLETLRQGRVIRYEPEAPVTLAGAGPRALSGGRDAR